jgi:TIR domain
MVCNALTSSHGAHPDVAFFLRCKDDRHDLRIGDKFIDEIDTAIRIRKKVVLVLSENSIKSVWVEDEVTTAHEEERKRGTTVLFPIRLDDAVVETKEAWAAKLRARHIGDFSQWKNHDDYQRTLHSHST